MVEQVRDMGPWVFSGIVALLGGWWTYRGTRGQNRTASFEKLTESYDRRLTTVENQLAHERALRHVHRRWDDQIYDQARQAGWDVPPPPPLD